MSWAALAKKTDRELKQINALPDHKIDLSDIPEITDWSKAVRNRFHLKRGKFVWIRHVCDEMSLRARASVSTFRPYS